MRIRCGKRDGRRESKGWHRKVFVLATDKKARGGVSQDDVVAAAVAAAIRDAGMGPIHSRLSKAIEAMALEAICAEYLSHHGWPDE